MLRQDKARQYETAGLSPYGRWMQISADTFKRRRHRSQLILVLSTRNVYDC